MDGCCLVHGLRSAEIKRSKVLQASDEEPVQLTEIEEILQRFEKRDKRSEW